MAEAESAATHEASSYAEHATAAALGPPPAARTASDSESADNGVPLDDASWAHLEALCIQSLRCTKAAEAIWKDQLMAALHDLDAFLTPARLDTLAKAKHAQARAAEQASAGVARGGQGGGGQGPRHDRSGLRTWLAPDSASGEAEVMLVSEGEQRKERRGRWRDASMNVDPAPQATEQVPLERHVREDTLAEWTEVDEPSKLPVLQLRLESVQTTVGAVKAGTASLGVSFVPEEWAGEPLFGADGPDLDGEDLKVVDRQGGTFRLTSTPRERVRLERVLELLVFAAITLKLEVSLRHDLACSRPHVEATQSSSRPSSPPGGDGAAASGDEENDSHIQLPGAYQLDMRDNATGDAWEIPQRWRSRWSSAGANSWLQLVLPNRDVGRRKSLRRSSTRYSTTEVAGPPEPPESTTRSSLKHPFGRMRDKAKGLGRRLRERSLKDPGVDLHKATTIATSGGVGGGGGGDERAWDFLGGISRGFFSGTLEAAERDEHPQMAEADPVTPEPQRFEKVVQNLAEFILSVSPSVLYPPPHLLLRLREQELVAADHVVVDNLHSAGTLSASSIRSDLTSPTQPPEGPPLRSAVPAVDSEAFALGFAGGEAAPSSIGLSQPSQSVVAPSRAARIALDAKAGLASLLTNNSSLSGCFRHQALQLLVQVVRRAGTGNTPCEPPRWITVPFFQQAASPEPDSPTLKNDATLSGFIEQLAHERERTCATCQAPNRDHLVVFLHQRERVEISVASLAPSVDSSPSLRDDEPATWTTCSVCQASTPRAPLTVVAGALSLAKFLELLLYDTCFIPVPDLCEHAGNEPSALVRSFAVGEAVVNFKVGTIALFELCLPTAVDPEVEVDEDDQKDLHDSHPVEELAQEISSFFTSVEAHLNRLEDRLTPATPDAPSGDVDALELDKEGQQHHVRDVSQKTISEALEGTLKDGCASTALALLEKLRSRAHGAEADCLQLAEMTAANRLNDARDFFACEARSFKLRLETWEVKHALELGGGGSGDETSPSLVEPSYFDSGARAFPVGSSVLVRDGERSSIIALALSAAPFRDVLTSATAKTVHGSSSRLFSTPPSQMASRRPSGLHKPIPSEFLSAPSLASSVASASPPSSPLRRSVARLDPDDAEAVFAPPIEVEYVAKWRKAPRPAGGSLFRTLGRKASGAMTNAPPSPLLSTADRSSLSVPLSDSILDDFLKTPEAPVPQRKQLRPVPSIISGLASRRDTACATPVCDVEATGFSTPRASAFADTAAGTIRSIASSRLGTPQSRSRASSVAASSEDEATETDEGDPAAPPVPSPAPLSGSRMLGTRLDGLFSGWSTARSTLGRLSPAPRWHDADDTLDDASSPPSEHIKLKFRQGSKTYRVTSFYEKRFQSLRAKCGLSESLFIESLTRCADLDPSGGKSGAAFLMTHDERFILKELTTKLGFSELNALLDFAPLLLDYLMSPERPSLLAKIFGIYTVKVVDSQTNQKVKVDLVVMEHLFYSKTISRQFDLKGIASRVAKPKAGASPESSTGWDGDWLTGSLQNQLLIYPHSKTLLRDALTNDVAFLSENGGIDFSLLVGVDDAHSELVVGLIDTLGVFNGLKVLEHHTKAAMRLATASDPSSITVQPPQDYAKRFLAAMERYFVAVPDKWTKPPGRAALDPDPRLACPL